MLDAATAPETLVAVERALTTLVRQIGSPRLHDKLSVAAGLKTERSTYPLLRRVSEMGPVRLTDLARLMGVEPSTVSRQITGAERDDLVRRRADPDDARACFVELTGLGVKVLAKMHAARREMLAAILDDWTPRDQALFAGLLAKLADGVSAYRENGAAQARRVENGTT